MVAVSDIMRLWQSVALRERVGMFLLQKGHGAEAKRELEEVVRIRVENKWRVPQAVLYRLESDELRNVSAAKDNRAFYRKYATLAGDRAGEVEIGHPRHTWCSLTY